MFGILRVSRYVKSELTQYRHRIVYIEYCSRLMKYTLASQYAKYSINDRTNLKKKNNNLLIVFYLREMKQGRLIAF